MESYKLSYENKEALLDIESSEISLSSPQERVAFAVLLYSGLIAKADSGEFSIGDHINPVFAFVPHFNQNAILSDTKLDIAILSKAIVAIELYNRNSFERYFEEMIARISLALQFGLPNFSYGISQIRPETAKLVLSREMLFEDPSDEELLNILMDDAQNIIIASRYIEYLVKNEVNMCTTYDIIKNVASKYNGQISQSVSSKRFVRILVGAYTILSKKTNENLWLDQENSQLVEIDNRISDDEINTHLTDQFKEQVFKKNGNEDLQILFDFCHCSRIVRYNRDKLDRGNIEIIKYQLGHIFNMKIDDIIFKMTDLNIEQDLCRYCKKKNSSYCVRFVICSHNQ